MRSRLDLANLTTLAGFRSINETRYACHDVHYLPSSFLHRGKVILSQIERILVPTPIS